MVEYTPALESQIIERLRTHGVVFAEDLPGLSADDAVALFATFNERWSHTGALAFDGSTLRAVPSQAAAPASPAPAPGSVYPHPPAPVYAAPAEPSLAPEPPTLLPPAADWASPVDQVLGASGTRSALDTPPSEAVPKAWWLLPIVFGLIGGVAAWLIARHEAPRTGRNMLILGVVVQVVAGCSSALLMPGLLGSVSSTQSAAWPPSSSGKPAFYYFGTST